MRRRSKRRKRGGLGGAWKEVGEEKEEGLL
jgi:hypothetical protein